MEIKTTEWVLDNLENIDGHKLILHGNSQVIDCPFGKALEFDGQQDAIFFNTNPLAGMSQFTVEVIFRPDADGLEEQRFLHIGDVHGDRFMFEIRLTKNRLWFVDNYLCSGTSDKTLYNKDYLHNTGEWTHAAAVFDGHEMRNYISGKLEEKGTLDYQAMTGGKTSIGVRQNNVCWFKGAIHKIRISPWVLIPDDFISLREK
jgi:hypothetical protein